MTGWSSTWRRRGVVIHLDSMILDEAMAAARELERQGWKIEPSKPSRRAEHAQALIQAVQRFKMITMLTDPERAVHRIATKAMSDLGQLVDVPTINGSSKNAQL